MRIVTKRKQVGVTAVCLMLCLSSPAQADDANKCASLTDAKERLACYDAASPMDVHASAKQAVLNALKDPSSAAFKDVFISSFKDKSGTSATCGWINAKNSFGGYVGYRKFYVLLGEATIVGSEKYSEMTGFHENLWNTVCKRE